MAKTTKFYGTGRRKSSIARVYITPGTGKIVINKKDMDEYFGLDTLKVIVKQPLVATGTEGKYDVLVNVCGGGFTGQAGAIRHGISRALLEVDAEYRPILIKTATVNDWKAICWADGQIYKSMEFPGLEILDRVGGGDSFASGLIYGLMTFGDAQQAVNYGVVHGALAMTTPGDTSMASLKEVEAKVHGAGARVQR